MARARREPSRQQPPYVLIFRDDRQCLRQLHAQPAHWMRLQHSRLDAPGEEGPERAEVLVGADRLQPLAESAEVALHVQRRTCGEIRAHCLRELAEIPLVHGDSMA